MEVNYYQAEEEERLTVPVDGIFRREAHDKQFSRTQHVFLIAFAVVSPPFGICSMLL